MKHESFEEFINRVSDEQHQGIDNYDGFMTNLRRGEEERRKREEEYEKYRKSQRMLFILLIVCLVALSGLQVLKLILVLKGY